MGELVKIGEVLKDFFGGKIPTLELISQVFGIRKKLLPAYGLCNEENVLPVELYKVIVKYLENPKLLTRINLCENCPCWDCPVKRGTVDFS